MEHSSTQLYQIVSDGTCRDLGGAIRKFGTGINGDLESGGKLADPAVTNKYESHYWTQWRILTYLLITESPTCA